jgi:hypothetical protein
LIQGIHQLFPTSREIEFAKAFSNLLGCCDGLTKFFCRDLLYFDIENWRVRVERDSRRKLIGFNRKLFK